MNPFDIPGIKEIVITVDNIDYLITADNLHGKDGFRVSRYVCEETWAGIVSNWDESYQFYETWDNVLNAIKDPELQIQGRADF